MSIFPTISYFAVLSGDCDGAGASTAFCPSFRRLSLAGSNLMGLASMIGKAVGMEPLIEETGGSDESLIADSRLVRDLTGMEPCMKLERGISEYLGAWDAGPAST